VIIHDTVEQGTPEWFALRAGKFTASIASKMVTPTGIPSLSYRGEIGRIIAESVGWQEPEPLIQTEWMRRGIALEGEARRWFTVETGLEVAEVGFIESDGGLTGFSPDGLCDHPMMASVIPVEIKVPKPSTHIGWLLEEDLPKEHKAQVHFGLAITDAPHAYFMSYSTHCAPLIIKVEADDYTETMVKAINNYAAEFEAAYKTITGVDYGQM
jgi:hypothetical protein